MTPKMELWIGETNCPAIGRHDLVMDSVVNYYKNTQPKVPYIYNKLFLDSGAFSFIRNGTKVDKERIKHTQEKLYPDKAIPLDYPFLPGMNTPIMQRLWKLTTENILEWQETTKLREIVPVLHAWDADSLIQNIMWMYKHANSEYVAIGTIVTPSFSNYTGYFGDRQPSMKNLDLIMRTIHAIKHYTDFKIHITGFGSSALTLHLAYYMGVESVDSAGYRRKAAYGKILLPGTGERYVGMGNAKFGVSKLLQHEWELLLKCNCSVCRNDKSLLWKDWKARAVHNKYVLEEEVKIARELLSNGLPVYENYLNQMYQRSTKFAAYWGFIKKQVKQLPLDFWI